jgi:hypothetical protein
MATVAEKLTEIETGITQIVTSGQSFTVDGITYNRGNLSALYQIKEALLRESMRTSGQRPVFRGFDFTSAGYSDMGND